MFLIETIQSILCIDAFIFIDYNEHSYKLYFLIYFEGEEERVCLNLKKNFMSHMCLFDFYKHTVIILDIFTI